MRCLSDKIAETLRGELAAGRYGPGRDFPSVDALRQRFGAGEYAVPKPGAWMKRVKWIFNVIGVPAFRVLRAGNEPKE